MVFTSFVICYKEKGKKSVEEIMEENNKMIHNIVNFWEIGQKNKKTKTTQRVASCAFGKVYLL